MLAFASTRASAGGPGAAGGPGGSGGAWPPDSKLQELVGVLGELRAQLESVAHLERLKTYAISARDLDALAEITQREEDGNAALRALEQRRFVLVQDFYADGQVEPTIEQLARTLGGPRGEVLQVAAQTLRSTIDDLRAITRHNEGLLTWAADLARSTAQWLLGYGQVAPAYTKFGDRPTEPLLSARNWKA